MTIIDKFIVSASDSLSCQLIKKYLNDHGDARQAVGNASVCYSNGVNDGFAKFGGLVNSESKKFFKNVMMDFIKVFKKNVPSNALPGLFAPNRFIGYKINIRELMGIIPSLVSDIEKHIPGAVNINHYFDIDFL